jgi:hypothetical protein
MLKNWWKYSAFRFYVLNTIWNYKFWLGTKKVFDIISSNKKDRFGIKESLIVKKRFKGYLYKGNLYLDNPGIPNIPRDVWESWKTKSLIK